MMERPTGSFLENREAYYAWWAELARIAKKRYHALPEDKGIPVPYTACRTRYKYVNGAGVSASSRVVSHRYADEGDKGKSLRREIKRVERAQWLSEWQEEQESQEVYDTAEWFAAWAFWWEDDATCGNPYCEVCE
jgi:hypothetical protein